nr:unnamed protein product [Digitaria exilis]
MSRLAFLLMLLPFSFLVSATKPEKISRSQFPKNFLFGTASSAYQFVNREDSKWKQRRHSNRFLPSISGVEPFVTLFHWDSPQVLEEQYGGFLSQHIVEDFRDYANICFREFGDRVKNWITFNEPWSFSTGGYASGVDEINNENLPLQEALVDNTRIEFYQRHLFHIQRALKGGADVRGYFAWSLFDNFEWAAGYTVRFGINYVNYKDDLKRYPKHSKKWFQDFLHK